MRKAIITSAAIGLAAAATAGGVASAAGSGAGAPAAGSRLDDGKALLPQAKLTEEEAITAAQGAAQGALNEVDLEHYEGKLVFNVDVGADDVKVDAATGQVVHVSRD